MRNKQSQWLTRAVAISILLHLLIFLGSALLITWDISPFAATESLSQTEENPPPPIVFELVDTPESARTEQNRQPSKYVSDKSARAQNERAPEDLQIGNPFSEGEATAPQLPEQPQASRNIPEAPVPQSSAQAENVLQVPPKRSSFSREFLSPSQQKPDEKTGEGELQRPATQNLRSRTPDLGSFSLNTYNWEYAPYMLRLKRKIEKNIFPPPAFTYMGMISGTSYLKFRISSDGKLEVLEVLDYNGHKSLMETSWRAIEVSAPFEPLPEDFPEKYLEITARFEYYVRRGR
jgi:hypothetical protein